MTATNRPGTRLTWDPTWPLPYESGWAVFAKVLAYNNLELSGLVQLIRRREAKLPNLPLNLCDGGWIDFDRYGELLAIDPERLRKGFWNTSGLSAVIDDRYAIRQCPICWNQGYHCLMFDLSRLATCPWHGCELTKSCTRCARPATISPGGALNKEGERICTSCRIVLPTFAKLLKAEGPSPEFCKMVLEKCQDIVQWFNLARDRLPEGDILLKRWLLVGEANEPMNDTRRFSWPLGRVQMEIGGDPPWHFLDTPRRVNYGSLSCGKSRSIVRGEEVEIEIDEDAGRIYRSIRRHLFRRYVRTHRDCFSELCSCDREESLALDSEHVCIVSLAFVVWRMSIEGLVNIEGLKFARTKPFAVRLMRPERHEYMSPELQVRWCYFGFFGIWEELTRLCQSDSFRVIRDSFPCSGHLIWQRTDPPVGFDRHVNSDQKGAIDCHVLYPESTRLIAIANERCAARDTRESPVDQRTKYGREIFDWARPESNSRRHLFQLKHWGLTVKGQYRPFYV